MGASGFLAVGAGAAIGAWLRWWLSLLLNAYVPQLPMGTLAANLIGGFLIGVVMEAIGRHGGWPEPLRLFVITGFLGALTTFSTFSAEVVAALMRAHYGSAMLIAASHLAGSLAATALGIYCVRAVT